MSPKNALPRYILLILDGRTWYLGSVSTVHMYLSISSITIDMDHWFDWDSSRLVMDNSIPFILFYFPHQQFMCWCAIEGWAFPTTFLFPVNTMFLPACEVFPVQMYWSYERQLNQKWCIYKWKWCMEKDRKCLII